MEVKSLPIEQFLTIYAPVSLMSWRNALKDLMNVQASLDNILVLKNQSDESGGFVEPVRVCRDSEFGCCVVDGHHRVAAAILGGHSEISFTDESSKIESVVEITFLLPSLEEDQIVEFWETIRSFPLNDTVWVTTDYMASHTVDDQLVCKVHYYTSKDSMSELVEHAQKRASGFVPAARVIGWIDDTEKFLSEES